MIERYLLLNFTTTSDGSELLSLDSKQETPLNYDAFISLKGGDIYADTKKIVFIFSDSILHLYYNFDSEKMRDFTIRHKDKKRNYEITSSFSFTNPYSQQVNDGLFVLIDALTLFINLTLFHKSRIVFDEEKLVAVLSSDPHGDLVSFLLPLSITGNLRICNIKDNKVNAEIKPKCICILDGDYYSQDASFFATRKPIPPLLVSIIDKYMDELLLGFSHSLLEACLFYVMNATREQEASVFALIGNHDQRLIDYSVQMSDLVKALILIESENKLYIIQHGLFNVHLCYLSFKGFKQPFDTEIMDIVYQTKNLHEEFLDVDKHIRVQAISFSSIIPCFQILNENYIKTK